MDGHLKAILDYFVFPFALITGWIFQWLPVLGFLVPIIYYSIQIYESKTFKQYRHAVNNRKMAKIAAKILRLKAQIVEREAMARREAAVAKVVAAANVSQAAAVTQLAQAIEDNKDAAAAKSTPPAVSS